MKFLFVFVTLFLCKSMAEYEEAEEPFEVRAFAHKSFQPTGCEQESGSKENMESRFKYIARLTNRPGLSKYGRTPSVYRQTSNYLTSGSGYKSAPTKHIASSFGTGSAGYIPSHHYGMAGHAGHSQSQTSQFGGYNPVKQQGMYGNNENYGYGNQFASGRTFDKQSSTNVVSILANMLRQRKGRAILRRMLNEEEEEVDEGEEL